MKQTFDGIITWDKCQCGRDLVGLEQEKSYISAESMFGNFTGREVRVTIEDIDPREAPKELELVMSYA